MHPLTHKVWRDLWHMRGQVLAIVLVIASGMATFVMSLSTLESLTLTQRTYYDRYRFADVFASMTRAPEVLRERITAIPGVARVQTRVVVDVTLDVPGLAEPAVGRLISLPERGQPVLNALYLRHGRFPTQRDEVLVAEAFATAHNLRSGDTVRAIINERQETLRIVGVALSPEYVLQMREGDPFPDAERFGVFWMNEEQLAAAYDMEGAFNNVTLTLMRGASEQAVIDRLDALTERYGSIGAFDRADQISHRFLTDEIAGLRAIGLIAPTIFLGVAAFLLNVVMSRLISTQREQIAALKAFGYTNREIGWHYLSLVLIIAALGVTLGTLFGTWMGRQLTAIYTEFYKFPVFYFRLNEWVVLLAIVLSAGAAMAGTLGALARAVRLPPAEAMRPEPPMTYRPTIFERLGLQRWISETARMILRRLERRPVKSLLSCLGLAMAVAVLVLGRFSSDALDFMIDYQFRRAQRQDMTVAFVEPTSWDVQYELASLPGVLRVEPFRSVPVRLRSGHLEEQVALTGLQRDATLWRLLDAERGAIDVPPQGLLLSAKLAELLNVRPGEFVTVAVREGERPVQRIPVAATVDDYTGTNAYMSLEATNRLMREGGALSGAHLLVDPARQDELYRELKETPRVANVTVKQAMIQGFLDTIAENQERIRSFNIGFAIVIAFGVVYNTARIALSERSREFATLRVIGFTRAEVSVILLGELAVLVLLAIPIGCVIGYGFAAMVSTALDTELYRIPLVVSQSTYALAASVVLIAAVVSGLIVRHKIDQLNLIDVLKAQE